MNEIVPDALAELLNLIFLIGLGDDDELVAAVSCDEGLYGDLGTRHLQSVRGALQRIVTFDVAVLVVDLLELVEIDHENVAVVLIGVLLLCFARDVFLELRSVVELRELVDGYLVIERRDVNVEHHDRASETEHRRFEPQGLKNAEYGQYDRIDTAYDISVPDRIIVFSECPHERPYRAGDDVSDRNDEEEHIVSQCDIEIFINDRTGEESKQCEQNESIYDRRYHHDHSVPEFLDVFLTLGDLNIYVPEACDGADDKRVHEIGDRYGEIIGRQIPSEDQGPENVVREIQDVRDDHVEEDDLL